MKRMVVLGSGESGVGAAILAKKKGYDVFVSDKGKIKDKYISTLTNHEIAWESGKHTEELIFNATEIVKSPGIPDKIPLMRRIYDKGIPVISEIEFGARYTNAKKICVTGSNGKTTTTMLIHHLLKNAGLKVVMAGNIGESFAAKVATETFDYCVLELSSFQLDNMYSFKADLAILLNITADHLDRYDYQIDKYIASKFRIIQNQTASDTFIYCDDDENIKKALSNYKINATQLPFSIQHEVEKGAYVKDEQLIINLTNNSIAMSIHQLALQGKHNLYNSMASGIAARVLELKKDLIRESLSDFQNVEHRLEFVANIHGISFINDSKATNVNSTWYALESLRTPIIWIVGGVDKGNDYSMLNELVMEKVKTIICLGKDNKKIHAAYSGIVETIVDADSAKQAVDMAYLHGKKGDQVLLSPACASFDLFDNFEDRGHQFKAAVKSL